MVKALMLAASLVALATPSAAQVYPSPKPGRVWGETFAATDTPAIKAHLENARIAAGQEWLYQYLKSCNSVEFPMGPFQEFGAGPTQVFDNFYFLGREAWNAWALVTSEGIIVFDAMLNDAEVKSYVVDGLEKFKLDPAQIRYVILGHGHADHYGGAGYLQKTYKARVIMGRADWDLTEAERAKPPARGGPATPLVRDLDGVDGMTVTLGDTTVRLYAAPGHTPGTLAAIFPVKDGKETRMVGYWGGSGMGEQPDPKVNARLLEDYRRAADRFRQVAHKAGVTVSASNHPYWDNTLVHLQQLSRHEPGTSNPFILGPASYGKLMTVLSECAAANALRQAQKPDVPLKDWVRD